MSHLVSLDPVDDAGIDIGYLEQRWNLWVSGNVIDQIKLAMRHAPSFP